MARFVSLFGLVAALHLAGCAEEQAPRTYVQSNAVSKDLFDGEWYFRTCVIDVNYEAGQFTFPGDCSADYLNSGGGYSTPRVRWLIDQNYLFAYRSYEIIGGANPDGGSATFRGEPLAAFAVDSHFDIRRDYNPVTGEEINVIVENTVDRHWWERQYVRVDWSQNLITTPMLNMASLYDLFDLYMREPVPWFIQEGSGGVGYSFPAAWRPRFIRTSAAEDAHEGTNRVAEYDPNPGDADSGEGAFYYMDFVTQEIFTPGMAMNPYTGVNEPWCMSQVYIDAPICTSALVTVRNAFLKVPPNRQYEPDNYVDSKWQKFGFWRMDRPTYDRGGTVDPNDPTDPYYGPTDFLDYAMGRFNVWQQSYDSTGTPIPLPDRQVRKVIFYTTSETPYHLIRPALEVVAEWNRQFMKMVRAIKGQALPEWENDPFHAYDPYTDEGYDCRIGKDTRDNGAAALAASVDDVLDQPDRLNGDSDFVNDRYLALQGGECVLVARSNSCVRHPAGRDGAEDPGEPCEQRGDMRYSFLSYVDQPGTDFLGIAEMRSDPVTGEFITGDANLGGPALDGYRTRALTDWDLQTGELTEEEYMLGEQSRQYMANVWGNVDRPAVPQRDFLTVDVGDRVAGVPMADINASMDRAMLRAERLRGEVGRMNTFSDRPRELVGTDIERILFDNEDALAASGITAFDPAVDSTRGRLDLASTFRTPLAQRMAQIKHMEYKFGLGCMIRPAVWIDHSVAHFVNTFRAENPGLTPEQLRKKLSFAIDRRLFVETQLHEFGHVVGLRHNFMGTTDPANYHSRYFPIDDDPDNQMPDEDSFDANRDGRLDTMELADLDQAQREIRRNREVDGVDWWMTSSLMDYTGQWYERLVPLGSYDAAATLFGYGNIVEIWAAGGDPGSIRPDRTPLEYWKYYHGGEDCTVDTVGADCPFSAGGSRASELNPNQVAFGATQECVEVPASYDGPDPDHPEAPAAANPMVCSNFHSDMAEINAGGDNQYVARIYKFCSDERTQDIGDCNRFDEGASYREIVQNARDAWARRYLMYNFRRFRNGFDFYGYLSAFMTYFPTAQKIYQEMFYKYAKGGDYVTDRGPFGFYDQYMASVDALNWFFQTLAEPNVGSYSFNASLNQYQYMNRYPYASGSSLNIPLGVGKWVYSIYQSGLEGINRLERIGTLYDKLWTMQLMMTRDNGLPYTRDEPYYVNFYDLFPREMTHLLTGLIADEPGYFMPRVLDAGLDTNGDTLPETDTRIVYPNFWQGKCLVDSESCWDADTSFAALTPMESSSFLVQLLGVSYALGEIPTFFDPTFQEQTQIYVAGSGGGIRLPSGAVRCPTDSDTDCDYALFESTRFRRQYLALKVSGSTGTDPGDNAGISFRIVQKAAHWQSELNRQEQCLVDAGGGWGGRCEPATVCENAAFRCGMTQAAYSDSIRRLRQDVDSYESFLRYMLEVQSRYGINSWISYSGSL